MNTVVSAARSRGGSFLSWFAIATLLGFCVYTLVDLPGAQHLTTSLRDWVTQYFDWLFVAVVSGVVLIAAALALHPNASRRIGRADARPAFSRWSWFSMLFSAGLASGLVYWGAAEPITHFQDNPFSTDSADALNASTTAVSITVFHWGLHGWGLYCVVGLAIALSAYRNAGELSFSAALTPVLGERAVQGPAGRCVDLIALYGTAFGVATSIGLAVGSMNAVMEPLTGLAFSVTTQIVLVLVISTLGVVSVLSGLDRGIRRLSEMNVWLSLGLMSVVVIIGPTAWLLAALPRHALDYAMEVIPMGLWLAQSVDGASWQSAWTVFYWGWWLAWTPFVAMFIARISAGRTIREFILGVLIVPVLVVITWMTVFGGTALHQEMAQPGVVSEAVSQDYSLGLVAVFQNLTGGVVQYLLLAVVAVLLFTWLITSLDSATLVICHILGKQAEPAVKVAWGFILGGLTCALILIGGMQALQAASIIIGLPMAFLLILFAVAAIKLVLRPEA